MDHAVRRWAEQIQQRWPAAVRRVGYFGSYARGDWGVGSDVDLIVIVEAGPEGDTVRASDLDTTRLPVPADLLVYTTAQWHEIVRREDRFGEMLREGVNWVQSRKA